MGARNILCLLGATTRFYISRKAEPRNTNEIGQVPARASKFGRSVRDLTCSDESEITQCELSGDKKGGARPIWSVSTFLPRKLPGALGP